MLTYQRSISRTLIKPYAVPPEQIRSQVHHNSHSRSQIHKYLGVSRHIVLSEEIPGRKIIHKSKWHYIYHKYL